VIKAACHVHSQWSYDGKWALPELAKAFSERGYRVLMLSEHDRGFTPARLSEFRAACAKASSEEILLVPGIEYSDRDNVVHTLVWGPVPFLGENLPTMELLEKVSAAGGLAVFAHPSRKEAWKRFDQRWVPHLLGLEMWNRKTDGWAPSKTAAPLLEGTSLLPFVGMDFHTARQFFPLATELENEQPINESAVLQTLRSRRCRSTAWDRPLDEFLGGGWRHSGLQVAEFGRRTAASAWRKVHPAKLSSS